jgi:hypothetical protein
MGLPELFAISFGLWMGIFLVISSLILISVLVLCCCGSVFLLGAMAGSTTTKIEKESKKTD